MSEQPFDPFAARPPDPEENHEPTDSERQAAETASAAWRALRDGLGAASASTQHGELQCVELCPICRTADVLRASGPPELRDQLGDFQREALMAMRALLDHYIERLEPEPDPDDRVQDIPIN